jgi:membrane-associated phospholipid phosphatase
VTGVVARAAASPALVARASPSPWPRRAREALVFAAYSSPFVAVAVVYAELGHLSGLRPVHVQSLHALDAALFSIPTARGPQALSDVLAARPSLGLDLACGFVYLLYLAEVFGVAGLLFFRARPRMLELSLGFLLVNLLGWAVWVLYPSAPPWYVDAHGFAAPGPGVASNAAGLLRVDAWLGVDYFRAFYAKSAYVFGSFPSLHVAYAALVALVTARMPGKLPLFTTAFAVAIGFAAVYLRHHYVLDVFGGAALACVAWLVLQATPVAARRRAGAA